MSDIKTAGDLRSFLIETMQEVRDGKVDTGRAHAISKLAAQINHSISTEVSAAIQFKSLGKGTVVAGDMLVGSEKMQEAKAIEPPTSQTSKADPDHFNLPGSKSFCDQCDHLVSQREADQCSRSFCSLK